MAMEQQEEDVVIVGAGLAGLAVALGLHRKGVRSVVLESSPALRASGFAFAVWPNAFRALDALGVGDRIRSLHLQAQGLRVTSSSTGEVARDVDFSAPHDQVEFRCVRRDVLLQVLEAELPRDAVRYSAKIVSIEDQHGGDDGAKIVHLADGSTLRAKVLIGCDGVNSVVARWLGLAKPSYSGRSASRGLAHYPGGHAFDPKFLQFFGQGFRFGYVPCNADDVYWFFTWSPSPRDDNDVDKSGAKMKQYVLTKLRSSKVPEEALELVQRSEMSDDAPAAPLRFRSPISLMLAKINKGNVCVAGDALHPMTPDLGQGGCAALEDGVVLARCLGEAILDDDGTEKERIELGLRKYARIRRWRSIQLVGTAYIVGFLQQSNNVVVSFLREKVLAGVLATRLVKMSNYDCGTLSS
ncbi:unnamed protein product [Alopecurus aequalis]